MEQLVMNRKERQRLAVLSRVKDKQWPRRQAAEILGLSLRQMHRIVPRYLSQGDAGLVHRSRGRPSPRRIDAREREKALALYRSLYRSFGPTLLAEKLGKDHGIWVSHDTARRWLISEGLLEKPRRGRRSRQRRPRRERFGQMVQMDGSHHRWFEERAEQCCLMVMIDDATGRMQGRFFGTETLAAAMEMMRRWCERFGIPQSLYVDRHGIYRCDREPTAEELRRKQTPVTQFGRAMKELDVRLILAQSPQAKGRVERANGTLQDRLVKELRLAGIDSVASANRWLEQSGFFEELNEKFAVAAIDPADAHRPAVMRLNDVLCVKEKRSVSHDGCVQWQGRTLQLQGQRAGLREVEVWEQLDGTVRLLDGGGPLTYGLWTAPAKVRRVIKNNKAYKPGRHQHLKLPGSTPWPKPESRPGLRKTG
jgi:transposase